MTEQELVEINAKAYYPSGRGRYEIVRCPIKKSDYDYITENGLILSMETLSTGVVAVYVGNSDMESLILKKSHESIADSTERAVNEYKVLLNAEQNGEYEPDFSTDSETDFDTDFSGLDNDSPFD